MLLATLQYRRLSSYCNICNLIILNPQLYCSIPHAITCTMHHAPAPVHSRVERRETRGRESRALLVHSIVHIARDPMLMYGTRYHASSYHHARSIERQQNSRNSGIATRVVISGGKGMDGGGNVVYTRS